MSDDGVFYQLSMIMNVDPAEIAKIIHSYIERDIGCGTVYDRLNCPKPPIYIKPVKLMTLRDRIIEEAAKELQNKVDKLIIKEDNEMKATSVQNIKNVKDVCFDISNDPIERKSKLTIVASTDDDIFAFEFEGLDLLQSCKRSGLFTGWEKDQKIRDLEEKLNAWKKEAADCLRLRDEVRREKNEEINKLKQQLQQAENDKREAEALKTPTNEEPSSRSDILDLAKKCVCGQREQDYGTPESNFQLIADLWNDYLGNNLSKEKRDFEKELGITHDHKELSVPWEISAMDVSMMMALLKIARIKNGGGSGDSFVDLAGYAACGGEIWHSNKETNTDSN